MKQLTLSELEAVRIKSARMVKVFGKREVEVLAMELLDRGLLASEFTRDEAIQSDPQFLGWEGFDLAVEWKWIVHADQARGTYRCSRAFIDRANNAQAKDVAEGIIR